MAIDTDTDTIYSSADTTAAVSPPAAAATAAAPQSRLLPAHPAQPSAKTFDYRLNTDDESDSSPSAATKTGCCSRLTNEFSKSGPGFFGIKEPNGNDIDVENTFAPAGKRTLFLRVLFFTATLMTIARRYFLSYESDSIYGFVGHLSHWALLFCALYQLLATICSSFRSTLIQPLSDEPHLPRFMVRIMWGLYSLAAPSILISTVLYWSLDFDASKVDVSIENIMAHGGVLALVWLDGLVIGRIPIRMKQILYLYIIAVAFIAWTVIADLTLGSTNERYDEAAADYINGIFSWSSKPIWAALWSAVALFGIVPLAYFIVWLASLWGRWCKFDGSRRRLYEATGNSGGNVDSRIDQRRYRKGLV